MKNYIYQNNLVNKKQLRQILGWSFTNFDSMQACSLADELKQLGFKYATKAGISISIEDLRVPFIKNLMLEKANEEIVISEKIFVKGKITEVERFQKIIDTWNLTSESLKNQVVYYFKNYDPLNSVYVMAFSGARGNLSQVRQLVGMRGLMSDPSGEIMNLPITHNFREGLTITDYLMSGYGARKGIVDTALKTANSGYLTRRLIDVAQDILIREKDCKTNHSILIFKKSFSKNIVGRILNQTINDLNNLAIIAEKNSQITPLLIKILEQKKISKIYLRSPLTCLLYRAVCQQCYGWDLSTENLVDIGEAVGILAGQSIGEPGTQLTMRTFHTGGIFTSEISQQITSPTSGIVRFSKSLEKFSFRTNRGEEVYVTKNSGSLIIIPDSDNNIITKVKLSRNVIIFPKPNQYIRKNNVIGELINPNKQLRKEVKPILSHTDGEIIISKLNNFNDNTLLWILSGQLYNSPKNSFVNFYSDYKINRKSYIFRTKLVSASYGTIQNKNLKKKLYKRQILLQNNLYYFINVTFQNLKKNIGNSNSILKFTEDKYLLNSIIKNFKTYLKITRRQKFAKSISNNYKTKTGGILFYDSRNLKKFKLSRSKIYFYYPNVIYSKNYFYEISEVIENLANLNKYGNFKIENGIYENKNNFPKNLYRTLIWIQEETYYLNCEPSILLVENGDFILDNFEIIPNSFSKTSGLVILNQKNNIIETLTVRSGLVYEGPEISSITKDGKNDFYLKKLFFPGEEIFSNIIIRSPYLCEQIYKKNKTQILIRPITLYEFSYTQNIKKILKNHTFNQQALKIDKITNFIYQSNQQIKTSNSVNLICEFLEIKTQNSNFNNLSIELLANTEHRILIFKAVHNLNLNNYIPPILKYKNLEYSPLVQKNQFIDIYTTFIYLESVTSNTLEIIKFKVNQKDYKQILLISGDNCIKVKKNLLPANAINDFIYESKNINHLGKIILENKKFFTIQKGQPYFFPKSKSQKLRFHNNLEYKLFPEKKIKNLKKINKELYINSYNCFKHSIRTSPKIYFNNNNQICQLKINKINFPLKIEFSKIFIKKNGNLYSSMVPRFIRQFNIGIRSSNNSGLLTNSNLFAYPRIDSNFINSEKYIEMNKLKLERTLLIQSNQIDKENQKYSNLTFIKFMEYPFAKTTKSIGLYSITEDLFEQELNSVFCYNNQFLENGYTIGLLNLEKEITGDIVQGLPRIEEILEARKKNQIIKRIPTIKKLGLLSQKTSLNENFDFHKLGTPIKENEKINPHKLLKSYFNYYGLIKIFFCNRKKSVIYNRLIGNFEGAYKSFKKVQTFILNSVQNVYKSQGVTINDKHLEIIVQQMTTKVLVTEEGSTPLVKREIINLYHIYHINKIIKKEKKQQAYYLPLVFGITRAALNNPSFISAASFQETTRVLTKAAIEGQIDWLRGLKENIIIGHSIPAGTGSRDFKICFKNSCKTSFLKNYLKQKQASIEKIFN